MRNYQIELRNLEKTCKKLKIEPEVKKTIIEKYEQAQEIAVLSSKHPKSILASLIYLVNLQQKNKINQEIIAKELQISSVSLRSMNRTIFSREDLTHWIGGKQWNK